MKNTALNAHEKEFRTPIPITDCRTLKVWNIYNYNFAPKISIEDLEEAEET